MTDRSNKYRMFCKNKHAPTRIVAYGGVERRNIARIASFCFVLLAFAKDGFSVTLDSLRTDVSFDSKIAGAVLSEAGAWRTKTQQIFDPVERQLIRRLYTVWDSEPSRDLDFVWISDSVGDGRDGRVNGRGRLLWRSKGKAAYDPASVAAEFYGSMKDGRPDGRGSYLSQNGLTYDGEWKNGLMEGYGSLKLPNADEYVGHFSDGKANGNGRYIDTTGEIFEGPFLNGLRHGRGTTKLPNGLSYQSIWDSGKETEGTRAVRLSQLGTQQLPAGTAQARVTVELSGQTADPDYVTSSIGSVLWIRPSEYVLDAWKGNAALHSGSLPAVPYLDLRVGIQNRSTQGLQISAIYIDVQSSATDLQPVVTINAVKTNECGTELYQPQKVLKNFGWGPAEDATVRFSFTPWDATKPPETLSMSKSLGRIDKTVKFDLEPDLRAAGVDVALFSRRSNGVLQCRSRTSRACLRELKSAGVFGSLGQFIEDSDNDDVAVGIVGQLEYNWTDYKGVKRNRVSKINDSLILGHLKPSSGCAEEAGPEVPLPKPLKFKLDEEQYRLPILVSPRALPPGRTYSIMVSVSADKASQHEFRFVAQMSDGSEISSRPMRLLYYVPSWHD
jgi:hypothetical protein